MTKSHLVVPDFFDGAGEIRSAIETHFSNPNEHGPQHEVWNYWYVPEAYTYLRTELPRILPPGLADRFLERIQAWARSTLGLTVHHEPFMSLYVNGCGQTFHNDALNGQMAYVYSVTKWEERTFLGGETMLWRMGNYWETSRMQRDGAGHNFYEKIPPRFNQLLVFDDRVIHGVDLLKGTMDPLAGRIVIHGHLRVGEPFAQGALPTAETQDALIHPLSHLKELTQRHAKSFTGFMTFRLLVHPDGRVSSVQPLCDRLVPLSPDRSSLGPFREEIQRQLAEVVFPRAEGTSEVVIPLLV